jgi:hypothetical protein
MSFNIPNENKDLVLKKLAAYMSEYTNLSQMFSFSGTQEDRSNLNEYAATILDQLFSASFEGAENDWNWQAFQEVKSNWKGQNHTNTKEEIIEYVIYNIGNYDSSMHTGEKWEYIREEDNSLIFEPMREHYSFSMKEAFELKEQFSNIKDIEFKTVGLNSQVRLYISLYVLN